MSTRVEASTISAGQLFSTNFFHIPDFQRDYSWTVADEVGDFWRDLSESLESPPYFLGLLIVTEEDSGVKTVVDGQQRLTTLTLLANAIRIAAQRRERSLIADNMRDTFLYGLDYETERRKPRLTSTSTRDESTLRWVLEPSLEPSPESKNDRIAAAQRYLVDQVEQDIAGDEDASRLGRWARLVSNGLTFAMFDHPDRNAAYKVYEVVNARGRDLTPAELIKSFVMGKAGADSAAAYDRWAALEKPFQDLGAENQFTQFVRHVVTLRHGYVIPRDLYQEITREYPDRAGTERLLTELEGLIQLYLLALDPSLDSEYDDEIVTSFGVIDAIGLSTVRPVFLAMTFSQDRREGFEELLKIVVPRIATGPFGTGGVERQFADAARAIFATQSWREPMATLGSLRPRVSDFVARFAEPIAKSTLHVLRCSLLQASVLPTITGHLHQVRPANAEDWTKFDDTAYKVLGGTIGNYFVSTAERRPRNTHTEDAARDRLVATRVPGEVISANDFPWTPEVVARYNEELAAEAKALWYGVVE